MNENEEIKKLLNIKSKIQDKEKQILDSQIKQNILYSQLEKLKLKKERINKGKKSLSYIIVSYIIYDIIMITILILFISSFLDKLILMDMVQKTKYLIELYLGVAIISTSAALISSKIDKVLIKCINKKSLVKIENKINEKKNAINIEINKQETLRQEITNIINCLDNITPSLVESENNNITIDYTEKNSRPFSRIKRIENK